MPRNYTKVVDDRTQLQYEHGDGTYVLASKQADGSWTLLARGRRRRDIGSANTKTEARSRLNSWMSSHPQGLRGEVEVGSGIDFEAVDERDGSENAAAEPFTFEAVASMEDDIGSIEDELFE